MKAVILAGGLGTRISEESDLRPKPMVEIGGRPLLWHIMKMYSKHGINEFIICLGYKGYLIKEYFLNYYAHNSDLIIDLKNGKETVLLSETEPWIITLVDTGLETMTGGRLKRISEYIQEETFCMTYGDGLSDIDITSEIEFHQKHGKLATVAAVKPPGRFATMESTVSGVVTSFKEKSDDEIGWINGGFFILNPEVIKFIEGDSTVWEREPLQEIAEANQLVAYKHRGFWQPMDSLREKRLLDEMTRNAKAPWL